MDGERGAAAAEESQTLVCENGEGKQGFEDRYRQREKTMRVGNDKMIW